MFESGIRSEVEEGMRCWGGTRSVLIREGGAVSKTSDRHSRPRELYTDGLAYGWAILPRSPVREHVHMGLGSSFWLTFTPSPLPPLIYTSS